MNNNLERLQAAYTNLKTEFEEKVAELEEKVAELELRSGKYEKEYLREKAQEKQAEFRRKLAEKVQLALSKNTGRSERHLVKAFPTMKSHRYTNALEEVKKAILSLKRY